MFDELNCIKRLNFLHFLQIIPPEKVGFLRPSCPWSAANKKGPLAGASGPSLGRKRPRRAAGRRCDRLAALQQYATAPHKTQD
jgi:hypothetical protein